MTINYISANALSEVSGGASGLNVLVHGALSDLASINYVGPVVPPVCLKERLVSKAKRALGAKGAFFAFGEKRLVDFASLIAEQIDPRAHYDFFYGFTSWIRYESPRPYVALNDCCFRDYLEIYHDPGRFSDADVARICDLEALWLANAEAVLVTSEWAGKRIVRHYGLDESKVRSVGIFGAMDPPGNDLWSGTTDFYFVSTDYKRKNGVVCRKAMDLLWHDFPDATLRIIGAKPPKEHLVPGRVTYEGFFRKSQPEELNAYRAHLSKAFALLHPTDADTTAMILIEAAFFGCPAISVNDFAIPEVIGPAGEGMLLDRPIEASALAGKMAALLRDKEGYHARRARVRASALERHRPEQLRERLRAAVAGITDWTTEGGKR